MDGFIIENPDFIAAIGVFEVVHEVEQCNVTIGRGQIAFIDIHDLNKLFARGDAQVAVGNIRVGVYAFLHSLANRQLQSVNHFRDSRDSLNIVLSFLLTIQWQI